MSIPLVSMPKSVYVTETGERPPDRRYIGGKAASLFRLLQSEWHVPPFYCITAAAMQQAIGNVPEIDSEAAALMFAANIAQTIETQPLCPSLSAAIAEAHRQCFPQHGCVVVRSSAVSEDGSRHSFAGIYDSVLSVRRAAELEQAVRQVWLSANRPRAIAYRAAHGLPLIETSMAVMVQSMVDAVRSGVCFSVDPTTGNNDAVHVSSLFGLGEGLVSGGLSADHFVVSKSTSSVETRITEKSEQRIWDAESGKVIQADVPAERRKQPSLSDDEVRQVMRLAVAMEQVFGQPQDIEFCYDAAGQLHVLQSRAVTAAPSLSAAERGNHTIWDNSNIIESYCGVTTPMTFSFIRRAYSIVYHCFAEVMGISPAVVYQHRDTFDNMLGLFHGRVYYNLKSWYRLVRMFPGYHYNRGFMESMMGVKQSLFLEEDPAPISRTRKWLFEFPSLLRLLARSGWNFLRIRAIVEQFEQHFYEHYHRWSKIDFDDLPPHEIMRLHGVMEEKMLWNWKAPIINDFYVMVFYGALRKMCDSWCGDASLQNGLICGEGGLQSDQPAKLLIQMAVIVRDDEALQALVMQSPLEELPARVAADARFSSFNELMERYLEQFGLRCANELKLESLSYQDQPHKLYQIIRSYLQSDSSAPQDLDAINLRERTVRREAEQRADDRLRQNRRGLLRRWLFRWVLKNARTGVRNRENMRFARTRIYGILRRMLRSIGAKFAAAGILEERDDIFYLTIEEVWDYIKGTAVTTDLRALAELRKKEYESYRNEDLPPPDCRFETFGLAYNGNSFQRAVAADAATATGLSGIGCCPGIVAGRVQVVSDPASDTYFKGDILVAERTDPGWVPVFPAFAGILVERGSVLSHSAIVAREMGIPTIVGIAGLTRRLKSGDQVRMDGQSGQVEITSST